ncbi:MAG: hypothetical protein EA398_03270 [Deltaproteobacteria bacterium]|nr:MAG: hypothetical protein EA398_03270 [Deltaproteobacteria bacterium]
MQRFILAFAFTGLLAACGGDHDHDHDAFDLGHACEHMEDAATELFAHADAGEDLDRIERTHTRYRVTLDTDPEDESARLGYLELEIATAGRYALFASRVPADLRIIDAALTERNPVHAVTPVEDCAAISMFRIDDLEPGIYTIFVDGVTGGELELLLERAEGYEPND